MRRIEKNILIIGAGIAGRLLKKDIEKNYRSYRIVGFLDDKRQTGRLNVLGKIKDCQKVVSRYIIDEIVIAIPSADGGLVRRILLANLNNRTPIKIVPRSQRVIGRWDVRYEEIKPIEPEDFLGLPFTQKNVDRLKRFYKGKTIFVTGGAGSIGSDIVRQLLDLDVKKVIVYDNSEYLVFLLEQRLSEAGISGRCELVIGSILNGEKLHHLLKKNRPDIIFHAAAYKHVHLMQYNVDEAVRNNVVGTKTVVDAAIENKIPLLTFISTDKVVNPTSVMGATKKLGEYYIQTRQVKDTQFNIVRFGNVINSMGSVLPLFERQIALHGYVTVTSKRMKRFFMSIREAAQLVLESTALGQKNSIHILNMGELINVFEVAQCLIRSQGLLPNQDVEIHFTGLRRGEKLIEELFTGEEKLSLRTTKENERIFALKNTIKSPREIHAIITELEIALAKDGTGKALRQLLKRLFPSLKLRVG